MRGPRTGLRELADALRALHQHALRASQKDFEKLHGRVRGPGEVLQLALHDPLFAWLRPLSRQIAALDELADADETSAADLDAAGAAVTALLDEPGEFRAAYLVHLQAEPDLVLAHAALRRLLPHRPPVER